MDQWVFTDDGRWIKVGSSYYNESVRRDPSISRLRKYTNEEKADEIYRVVDYPSPVIRTTSPSPVRHIARNPSPVRHIARSPSRSPTAIHIEIQKLYLVVVVYESYVVETIPSKNLEEAYFEAVKVLELYYKTHVRFTNIEEKYLTLKGMLGDNDFIVNIDVRELSL